MEFTARRIQPSHKIIAQGCLKRGAAVLVGISDERHVLSIPRDDYVSHGSIPDHHIEVIAEKSFNNGSPIKSIHETSDGFCVCIKQVVGLSAESVVFPDVVEQYYQRLLARTDITPVLNLASCHRRTRRDQDNAQVHPTFHLSFSLCSGSPTIKATYPPSAFRSLFNSASDSAFVNVCHAFASSSKAFPGKNAFDGIGSVTIFE